MPLLGTVYIKTHAHAGEYISKPMPLQGTVYIKTNALNGDSLYQTHALNGDSLYQNPCPYWRVSKPIALYCGVYIKTYALTGDSQYQNPCPYWGQSILKPMPLIRAKW